ncbi:DUF986 domain-containing protein [Erwinia psidii]|uniref:DUF986 family protein n=1 Tax=Erwinia psidii TaxID=69224 RepID=UPI00226BB005|nr:DUF986 family protein [Erwinia psidii]MCX8960051.1 DUF986 domain-containing protein [Erwinia psidii]
MSLTDYAIILFIALLLLFAIYDQLISELLHGRTGLRVRLKRRNRLDSLIFIGLVIIVIYQNISNQGSTTTTTLLLLMAFMAWYLFWIRQPEMRLKAAGFYHASVFIHWDRIKSLNFSEDGVLVVELENRRLLIHVKKTDDLDNIYQFMVRHS